MQLMLQRPVVAVNAASVFATDAADVAETCCHASFVFIDLKNTFSLMHMSVSKRWIMLGHLHISFKNTHNTHS